MLKYLPATTAHPDVLVGLDTRDDAGVFQISESLAMIQTVDFFTPIVDDPYDFGQIAAANSLSDIYAMGGTPRTALNILGFPQGIVPQESIARIIQGGYDKATEAGVAILGGHSVKDPELKYGMAVTGFINPQHLRRNSTARVGDALVLTKPVGTGILTTALKNEKLPDDILQHITAAMKQLNQAAAETMQHYEAHACTDVTGYGLLGHLFEMTESSRVTARVFAHRVPLLPEVEHFAAAGNIPGGLKENRKYLMPHLRIAADIDEVTVNILNDPQTSGGLLIALPQQQAEALIAELRRAHQIDAALIGEIGEKSGCAIEVV